MNGLKHKLGTTCRCTTTLLLVLALAATNSHAEASRGQALTDAHFGMRLGETLTQVRNAFGVPVITGHSETGDFWSYKIDNGNAWVVGVVQRRRIVGIYLRTAQERTSRLADGTGVRLGDSEARLLKVHGTGSLLAYNIYQYRTKTGAYRLLYEVTNGRVTGVGITRSYFYPLPAAVTWDRRDGETPERAFLAPSSINRPRRFEAAVLAKLSCNGKGSWKIHSVQRVGYEGRLYDRVLGDCSVPTYRHNFFFDVTSLPKRQSTVQNSRLEQRRD